MVESSREIFGSVKMGVKNPKSVWWNNEVKDTVRRKELLAACSEEAKERYMEPYREEKRKFSCIYQSKKKVNEELE